MVLVCAVMSVPAFAQGLMINPYPNRAPATAAPQDITTPAAQEDVQEAGNDHPAAEKQELLSSATAEIAVPAVNTESVAVPAMPAPQKWAAFEDASLQEILKFWSEQAGVDFVWDTHVGNRFRVSRTMHFEGGYESAVESLLDQFNVRYVRPVAKLYIDPASQSKTLVVKTVRGL